MSETARVLVVDDEDIVLTSVKRILQKEGYQVDTALKAAEALQKAESNHYDLVITDLMMPEINGIELMHSLREKGVQSSFLMITGYPAIKTAMQALRLGAVDYIPKPFTRVELLSPVNRALRKGQDMEEKAPGKAGEKKPAQYGQIMPGQRFTLTGHSWAVYEQDGTIALGVEKGFLHSAGRIARIEPPETDQMVEQGHSFVKLVTEDSGEHGVFSPFTGRVMAVNNEVAERPDKLDGEAWLIRIIPTNLKEEAESLERE